MITACRRGTKCSPPCTSTGRFCSSSGYALIAGVDFAIRLINFATSRWVQQEESARQQRGSVRWIEEDESLAVAVHIDNNNRPWLGDRRVFRWHLDWPVSLPDYSLCINGS